ncbi:hypothetical protein D3C83_31590 [compost metagenome]
MAGAAAVDIVSGIQFVCRTSWPRASNSLTCRDQVPSAFFIHFRYGRPKPPKWVSDSGNSATVQGAVPPTGHSNPSQRAQPPSAPS